MIGARLHSALLLYSAGSVTGTVARDGRELSMPPEYDLIVIGSGPAGEKGAAQAAYFGKSVALVERDLRLGGASTNTGTLPSKTLRESALYFSGLKQRGLHGIDYSLRENLTVADFLHHEQQVVAIHRDLISRNIARHGIDLFGGEASFEDPGTILVRGERETQRLTGRFFLIATGSKPHRPPEIPFDDQVIYDSDSVLGMDRIPRSLLVVGGGVIGCEYASTFAALGVRVTLVESKDRLLPFLDAEISGRLRAGLERLGVEVHMEDRLASIVRDGDMVRAELRSGKVVEADRALFAAGRRGCTSELRLDRAGVAEDGRGRIEVNERFQTSSPHIYAAGDVIGFPALAATSMEQGRVAVCHAFQFRYKTHVSSMLPYGIYSIPEVSAAGETEESCRAKGIEYEVGRARYENNARARIVGDTNGLLKLVFAPDDLRLLGIHCVGEGATEIIHLGLMVLTSGGGIDAFIEAVFNFPTLSEMYKYAAYDGLGNLSGHKLREG